MGSIINYGPKRHSLLGERRHITHRSIVNICPPVFCTAHPLTQPLNPMLYNAFQSTKRPSKLPRHVGLWGFWPPLMHASLLPAESTSETASRSVQSFFAALTSVTGRLTNRPCYSVRSNRPHLACAAMQVRPKNRQVVKGIRQKDRIASAHRRFNRIRHVAPMCTAHNTWFFWHTHQVHLGRFSRFCTAAYGRESIYFTMGDRFPLPLRMGDGPRLT